MSHKLVLPGHPGLAVNSTPGSPIALQIFVSFSLVLILQAKWQSQDVNPECLGGVANGSPSHCGFQIVSILKWSNDWMIWGVPPILGNLHDSMSNSQHF